ncbi:hypothetical protein RHEC894_CH02494 [Rhizobium sp. CIAT894]|uniref:hypothetical protein n=1 Tax=Rhizobium sp. CIAT894 TaxID=2020312 RepID=UPI000A1FFF38|nr:hypothetical protein [Rhizobium sp. CIAT894]ARM88782.1 hypothetical protein RHEC894_CH02494 [Rhizobium sp. CIAT894]
MIGSRVLGHFAVALHLYSVPQESLPQEAVRPIKVTYAVVVDGKEPVSAEVSCFPDTACQLTGYNDANVALAITVYSGSGADGELSISCWTNPCSFKNSRSRINFSGRRVTVDIFSGEADVGFAIPLVIRQRPRIGEILISY